MRLHCSAIALFVLALSVKTSGAETIIQPGRVTGRTVVITQRRDDVKVYEGKTLEFAGVTAVSVPVADLEQNSQLALVSIASDGEVRGSPLLGKDIAGIDGLSKSSINGTTTMIRSDLSDLQIMLGAREQNRYQGLKELALSMEVKELTKLAEDGQKLRERIEKVQRLSKELKDFDQLLQIVEGQHPAGVGQ